MPEKSTTDMKEDKPHEVNRLSNGDKNLPPPYEESPPDLTASFASLDLRRQHGTPTPDECIAHLKLLEAFSQLRDSIALTNGLYGLNDDLVPADASNDGKALILSRIREKRWAVYVTVATLRFESYFRSIQPQSVMITQSQFEQDSYEEIINKGKPLAFSRDDLPPLDVLMVLHSFRLNPRNFLADCIRYGKMDLWATNFPWESLSAVIDNNTFDYDPGNVARKAFEDRTNHPWDNLKEPSQYHMTCPRCKKAIQLPWTTATLSFHWTKDGAGELGHGFTDKDFEHQCDCTLIINHDLLRSQKFRSDLQDLVVRTVPMPGTLLTLDGKSFALLFMLLLHM